MTAVFTGKYIRKSLKKGGERATTRLRNEM
jgi:hypothetical protein